MPNVGLLFGHVSSNIGDLALNQGLCRLLTDVGNSEKLVVALARPGEKLINSALATFQGVRTQIEVLPPKTFSARRLLRYCKRPERFFHDQGLGDVEVVLVHSGEHLYAPKHPTAMHNLAPWRMLAPLAAKATGRKVILLPSTFGPFGQDHISRVIGGILATADAAASREPYSAREVKDRFGIEVPTLLDPAFFLTNENVTGREKAGIPQIGIAMRLEDFGLRAGAQASKERQRRAAAGKYRDTITHKLTTQMISEFSKIFGELQVTMLIQSPADAGVTEAIANDVARFSGLHVELIRREAFGAVESPVSDYQNALAQLDLLVAARFHACVLALARNVPAVGVQLASHGHKIPSLFQTLGASDYHLEATSEAAAVVADQLPALYAARSSTFEAVWPRLEALRARTRHWFGEALAAPTQDRSAEARAALTDMRSLVKSLD